MYKLNIIARKLKAELVRDGEDVWAVHDTGLHRVAENGAREAQFKIDIGGTDFYVWTDGTEVDGNMNVTFA